MSRIDSAVGEEPWTSTVHLPDPGRLLDLVERRTLDSGGVSVLVLEEADRLLDMGFIPDVRRINGVLPQSRQVALFSATVTPRVDTVARGLTVDAVKVTYVHRVRRTGRAGATGRALTFVTGT